MNGTHVVGRLTDKGTVLFYLLMLMLEFCRGICLLIHAMNGNETSKMWFTQSVSVCDSFVCSKAIACVRDLGKRFVYIA